MGKPPGALYQEIDGGQTEFHTMVRSGDVKYHLGQSATLSYPGEVCSHTATVGTLCENQIWWHEFAGQDAAALL